MKKLLLLYQKIYIGGKKRKETPDNVLAQGQLKAQVRTDVPLLAEPLRDQKPSELARASRGPPRS